MLLSCVAHVSSALSLISCQENSYSSFLAKIRTLLWEVILAAHSRARDIYVLWYLVHWVGVVCLAVSAGL